ncbi:lipocalin family protein [Flavobacteriaceae bacterium LMO-SS05]|jgi:hypothetical protein
MKRVILLLLAIGLFSCSSSKTLRQSKTIIKGSWTLNSVTYDKAGKYNVTLLNDTSKDCFEGSTWQFVPNNNTGTYTINESSCSTGIRNFIFTIQEEHAETGLYDFMLKPTNEKYKSDTNQGFRLNLKALSETLMQWQQTLIVDGAPFTITMNFNKI